MSRKALNELFKRYRHAFETYQLADVRKCYKIPCTLQSSEQIVQINTHADFEREFIDIFTILKHANVCKLNAIQASYVDISHDVVMAVIDWAFLDTNNEVFTEFSGVYHLMKREQGYEIFSIVSHEINNAVTLMQALSTEAINT